MRNRGLGRRAAAALALILCLAFAGQAAFGALERRVDLDLVDAELADVFRALAELGDMNIVLDPAVRGTLTIRLHGLAVEDALRLVAYTTGVKYRVEGSTMIVLPPGAVSTSLEPLGIEKFSLTYARTTDVIGPARLVAGGAKLEADERTNSIIACGSAEELRAIGDVLRMLDVPVQLPPEAIASLADAGLSSGRESLEIIRLQHAPAQGVADLLALVVPADRMRVDSRTNTIVVIIDEASRERAMKIVSEVDVAEPPDDGGFSSVPGKGVNLQTEAVEAETVKVIKLAWAPVDRVREALSVIIDLSKVGMDSRTNSLIVNATPEQIARIEEIVTLLDVAVVAAEKQPAPAHDGIHMFKLEHASAKSVRDVLTMILPPEKMQVDERTNTVVIMADDDTCARVVELVETLDVETAADQALIGEEKIVETIPLAHASLDAIRDALALVVPKEAVVIDERTRSVIVKGTRSQRERAREIAALLDVPDGPLHETGAATDPSSEPTTNIRAFRLREADPESVKEALSMVMPKTSIYVDARTKSVLVVGLLDELARAAEIVALIDQPSRDDVSVGLAKGESEILEMRVIRLVHAPAAKIRDMIAPIMPEIRIAADERSNSLLIVASPSLQERAASVVTALDIEVPQPEQGTEPAAPRDPEVTRVVTLAHAEAAEVREALAPIVPISSITVDPRTNSLVIVAAQSRMDRALDVVAKLDVETAASSESLPEEAAHVSESPKAEVVRLKYASPSKVRDALAPTIPVSRISVDERTGSLVIVGTEAEMTQALAIIDKLDIEVLQPEQGTEPAAPRDPEVTR
ncbi:MAG TPA: secretin N-terminal domain-containing protein, partial [Bacillota bacterium]|nr:secretin N-terminal domain-containing protein [Bacillota bacterium]